MRKTPVGAFALIQASVALEDPFVHRALLAVAVVAFAATAAAPADAARVRTVTIEDIEFSPSTVRIERGARVRWVWRDGNTPHDVKSRGKRRFRSSSTKSEGTHTVRFRRRGTYRYVCTIHLNMDAKVVVR